MTIALFMKALKPGAALAKPAKPSPEAAAPDLDHPNFVGLLALLQQFNGCGQFGKHNVAEGDSVSFSAGEFSGSGAVTAAGEHGATVTDKTAREHRIHWHEVTGHKPAAGKKDSDGK